MPFKRIAAWYLFLQGIGGTIWWVALFLFPVSRRSFMADGSPDSMLLAFLMPDALLFVGGSFVGAYAIAKSKAWAGYVLWLHAGAAVYGSLYCWGLVIFSKGDGLVGSIMMTPSLVIPFLIAKNWGDRIPKNVR